MGAYDHMNMVYSGIGSRETPRDILELMTKIAEKLEILGYTLRSGGARGADTAFANGVKDPSKKIIFRPEHATPESIEFVSKYHPAWYKCKPNDRKLHGRNALIILGEELYLPSDFIIAWTPGGEFIGGTSTGLRIGVKLDIPIFNLYFTASRERLEKFLNSPS